MVSEVESTLPKIQAVEKWHVTFLHVAALRADARNENRHVADESANFVEFIGIRCADDERAVAVLVPLTCHAARDEAIERLTVHGQVLKLARAWIGSAAEYDDAFLRSREERLKRFGSEIRVNRDCVRSQEVERRIHVTRIGVADVGALGVENHRNIRRNGVNVRDGALQSHDAFRAVRLVKRGVRLVGAHEVLRRFHDCAIERDDGVAFVNRTLIAAYARGLGNFAELAVESDADEVTARPLGLQHLPEVSIIHFAVLLSFSVGNVRFKPNNRA